MAVATPAERIARQAHLLGFPLAGSAPLGALDRRPFLERWLAEGRAGEMDYLGRRMAERMDPRTAFPWARSIVSLAYPYRPPPPPAGDWRAELRGRIAAYTLDPRRCISYLTIEHRSAIPRELRPHLGNWIFGCDLCQQACPWNAGASDTDTAEALTPRLPPLLELDAAAFRARFGRTAVARAKRRGLLRNVAVVLGNSENPEAVPPLAAALL